MPTLTKPESVGELLREMEAHHGTSVIKSALMVSAYLFVRPSELAQSKWEYIDFDIGHWIIPAQYMKMKRDHLIPFPSQVRDILENLLPYNQPFALYFSK